MKNSELLSEINHFAIPPKKIYEKLVDRVSTERF